MSISAVGLPWFRKEDFAQLRALFIDAGELHRTYAQWLRAAELAEKTLQARGICVVRAPLRPYEFAAWCESRGLPTDAEARREFANEFAEHTVALAKAG